MSLDESVSLWGGSGVRLDCGRVVVGTFAVDDVGVGGLEGLVG